MRTTIEISDEQRAKLLEIAARRGEKGYSSLVREALERFLAEEDKRRKMTRQALAVGGSWSPEQAEELRERVREFRETWR